MSKKQSKSKDQTKVFGNVTYRVLVKQALSLTVASDAAVNELSIQGVACRIAIRPAHNNSAKQREIGGSILAIEFEDEHDADLLIAARRGFELVEDFLSATAVVMGSTFRPSVLVQVARLGNKKVRNCEFIQFIELPANHWLEPLTRDTISTVKYLLAHWDGLENGKRLRRAARQYRDALGNFDDIAAFQEAYIGLEAMEPPLARMAGLLPGTEEVKGNCGNCGVEFTRKKTSLVGVRALILGDGGAAHVDEQRKADWKLIKTLRTDLMHSLVDGVAIGRRACDSLVASMHYLHSSICVCSHASKLANTKYSLARGGFYIVVGVYTAASWPELAQWSLPLDTSSWRWVQHATNGLVPKVKIRNPGLNDLEFNVCRLSEPIAFATMQSLKGAHVAGY